MNVVIFEVKERHWECPSCGRQHVSRDPRPHTPTHVCPELSGLSAPFVEVLEGQSLKKNSVRHKIKEREDYIGDEVGVIIKDGRPVMALDTERSDGSNDTRIFPPVAQPNT